RGDGDCDGSVAGVGGRGIRARYDPRRAQIDQGQHRGGGPDAGLDRADTGVQDKALRDRRRPVQTMTTADALIEDLPDPGAARRFLESLAEKHSRQAARLERDRSLLSDALTLASFSPLLAATMLEHPEYLGWLGRKRGEKVVRDKEELLESLARFSLTNSTLEPHVVLARFRRRELLRIFLQDIRRLAAIAEITEEISNLADAILEHALRLARQELDNRYGSPLETDEKGREKPAEICIVSLGKLGSRELNYSSDIDLLFLYSAEGVTSGVGAR